MSILFTVVMVKLAEHYMGTNDHRNILRIVDVAPDGTILRENQLDLIISGKHKSVVENGKNAFIVQVDQEGLEQHLGSYYTGYDTPMKQFGQESAAGYKGRVPGNYEMTHLTRQWAPSMVRSMRIGASETTPAPPSLWPIAPNQSAAELAETCKTFSKKFPGGVVLVRSGKENSKRWGDHPHGTTAHIVNQLSRRLNLGYFSIVDSVAPHGGGNFEDLSILDSSDPSQSVIATVLKNENETIIYRCLIHGGNS